MKNKTLKRLSLLVCVSVIGLTSLVYAADHKGKGWERKKGLEDKIFHKAGFLLRNKEELGLGEEQVANVKALKKEVKKGIIKRDAEIEIIALDIQSALHEDSIDVANTKKLIGQKYDLKKEKTIFLVEELSKLKGVLQDDQKAIMKSLYSEKKEGCPFADKKKHKKE